MNNDQQSILRLMNEYCYRIDAGDLAGFAELFRHADWQVVGVPQGADTGYEEVQKTVQNVTLYDGKTHTKHVMSNVQIDIAESGDTAKAQSYISVLQAVSPDFPLQVIFVGHYRDTFEKVKGEWRFRSRDIHPDLIGDLSHHRADMA
ncbi:MAG: nuclear transport factor 2 family protein [Gammaproteobacteria bacterium]